MCRCAEVQKWCRGGAEAEEMVVMVVLKRCRGAGGAGGAKVLRCWCCRYGAQVVESRCSGAEVQRWCRVMSRFADVQRREEQRYRVRYRGAEVQCRDAERCREVQEVHRCRGAEVVLKRWCSWWW